MSRIQKKIHQKQYIDSLFSNKKLRKTLLETIPNYFHKIFNPIISNIQTDDPCLQRQIKLGWGFCGSICLAVNKILTLYRIPCKIIKVEGAYGNKEYFEFLNACGECNNLNIDTIMELRKSFPNAHSVGFGMQPKDDPTEYFHYIIEFPNSYLDMTANQACRPERNIIVENYWILKTDKIPNLTEFKILDEVKKIHAKITELPNFAEILDNVSKEIALALNLPLKKYDLDSYELNDQPAKL